MIDFPLETKCCPFLDVPGVLFLSPPPRQDAMSNPTADFDTPLVSWYCRTRDMSSVSFAFSEDVESLAVVG